MQDTQPADQTTPPPADAPVEVPADTPVEAQPDESVIEGSVETLRAKAAALWDSLQSNMLTVGVALEGAILLAAVLPAAFFGPRLRKLIPQL